MHDLDLCASYQPKFQVHIIISINLIQQRQTYHEFSIKII